MMIYIAGKYTDASREAIKRNIAAAEEIGRQILASGHIPIIPHKITSFWDEKEPLRNWKHEDWINKFCLPLMDRCDAVFMAPKWETSAGATMEYHHARRKGMKIYFMTEAIC